MPVTPPEIDRNLIDAWLPEERTLYQSLPYYLVKYTAMDREYKGVWLNLFDKINFQRNSGETLRFVWHNRTPVKRQLVRPKPLYDMPLMDVNFPREKIVDGALHRHRFVSQHFKWDAHFATFLKDRIEVNRRDIAHQIIVFEDEFYRTQVWDNSPYVFIAGQGMVSAPVPKTDTWLQSVLPNVTTHLDLKTLFSVLGVMETDIGAVPWSGSSFDTNQYSRALDNRYLLIGSNETWNAFIDDPWVKENRPLNLDIITNSLRGDFWGRIRFKPEYMPLHIKADAQYNPTFPEPELVTTSGNDTMRPRPNPDYSVNAQYTVSFIMGKPGYRIIDTSPPPPFSVFGNTPINWNGEIKLTNQFLVPYLDEQNQVKEDMNSWGEFLRFQAEIVLGMIAPEPHQIIPIIHKRKRHISTAT